MKYPKALSLIIFLTVVFLLPEISIANDCLKIKAGERPSLVVVPRRANGTCPKRAVSISEMALQGVKGEKGDRGEQGIAGLKGDRGNAGSDAEFNGAVAAGDLAGTYPNPTIDAGVIDADKFASLPSVKVRRTASVGVSVANATTLGSAPYQLVTFDQVLHDTAGFYDSVTDHVYAPRAGVYLVTGHVAWTDNDTGIRILRVGYVGGDTSTRFFSTMQGRYINGSFLNVQSFSGVLVLDEGDRIAIEAHQNSGGPLSLSPSSNGLAEMSVVWLHP